MVAIHIFEKRYFSEGSDNDIAVQLHAENIPTLKSQPWILQIIRHVFPG